MPKLRSDDDDSERQTEKKTIIALEAKSKG